MLPFSRDQFLTVFASYNAAIWPLQIAAWLLGAAAVIALFRPGRASSRFIAAVLALMWAWTGIVYHGLYFSGINRAAFLFGALFVAQAAALAHAAAGENPIRFEFGRGIASWTGLAFIVYSGVLYPLIGLASGDFYPETPMFGVTPCPVTLFTFGMFLLASNHLSRWLLAIPFLWSLVGGSAALLLNVPQDWVLLVSGIVSVPLILRRGRQAAGAG